MRKIVLTGGGTAGHIVPNIALIPHLKNEGFEIYYIGLKNSLEEKLIKEINIPFFSISGGKFRRYFDINNFFDIFKIKLGFFQSIFLLKKIKPDVVFSKGGYVSCPVVWAAWLLRIPVIIHESDLTPGLANKISEPFADVICYSFPETEKFFKNKKNAIFTGIPVRDYILNGNKEIGYKLCNFDNSRPVILVIGGSLGSLFINKKIRENLTGLLEKYQVCHICGINNIDKSLENIKGYKQFEFIIDELPHLFSISDLIISRSGATILFEILNLRKLNILIPLGKKSSRGDQIENALSFEKLGISKVIFEEELEKVNLLSIIEDVLNNKENYLKNFDNFIVKNSSKLILNVINKTIKN